MLRLPTLCCCIGLLITPGYVHVASAAIIAVETLTDEQNANGQCSLREAIINANNDDQSGSTDCTAGSGNDTIELPTGTYILTLGDLIITSDMTVDGAGARNTFIDGNNNDRVFRVTGGTVTIQEITIQNGQAIDSCDDNGSNRTGGGVCANGGGTTVTFQDVAIKNNTLSAGTSLSLGAGLYAFASGVGGASDVTVNLIRCEVSGNNANVGASGGDFGGGIYVSNNAVVNITNCTISGNQSDNGSGAGAAIDDVDGALNISNSTITNNTGGGIEAFAGTITVKSSIVASQASGDNCLITSVNGTITSQGFNLENVDMCSFGQGSDLPNTPPGFSGGLSNNEGPTDTYALSNTSAALETGDCTPIVGAVLTQDQRGATRPADGDENGPTDCDIGAYELACQGCQTVLPVELTAFEALADGPDVVLTWETASESNNAGFEVQQRAAGSAGYEEGSWEVLAFVEGQGTTLETQRYRYHVERLAPGRHLFRLKQVDFDGTFEYSPEVEATIEVPGAVYLSAAYPNPFNPNTVFTLTAARMQHVKVAVYDVLGRHVVRLFDGVVEANQPLRLTFEAHGMPSGTYVIRASGDRFTALQRVVLAK